MKCMHSQVARTGKIPHVLRFWSPFPTAGNWWISQSQLRNTILYKNSSSFPPTAGIVPLFQVFQGIFERKRHAQSNKGTYLESGPGSATSWPSALGTVLKHLSNEGIYGNLSTVGLLSSFWALWNHLHMAYLFYSEIFQTLSMFPFSCQLQFLEHLHWEDPGKSFNSLNKWSNWSPSKREAPLWALTIHVEHPSHHTAHPTIPLVSKCHRSQHKSCGCCTSIPSTLLPCPVAMWSGEANTINLTPCPRNG